MIKTLLTVVAVVGITRFSAEAQTTPAGSHPAGTPAKSGGSIRKTAQDNSGNTAPNRSSTAGVSNAATSNNPVDATGKPMGTTESNSTSTVKAPKRTN
jgi:hypothetical protein